LSRLVHRSAAAAVQELNDVVCRLREGVDAEKVVSARCLTSDALVDSGKEEAPLSETASKIADEVAQLAQQEFLGPLLASSGKHALDLGELLWTASAKVLDRVRSKPGIDEEILLLAGPSADIEQIARATSIRPHRCGHVRCTVVVAPNNWRNGALEEVVANSIPLAAFTTAKVATPLLIREASELSLAQVASRILELQPDVREAATRLHTRADVQWAPIAPVVTVDEC
jgi:hypothetical protein